MNWQNILDDLRRAGWTQVQIAERCGVVQSTISSLSRAGTEQPIYPLGAALVALHADVCTQDQPL